MQIVYTISVHFNFFIQWLFLSRFFSFFPLFFLSLQHLVIQFKDNRNELNKERLARFHPVAQ